MGADGKIISMAKAKADKTMAFNREMYGEVIRDYNDPGFLAEDDFISCYDQCRGKRVSDLSDGQVRGCITFLLRQMRHEYGTPRCLVNGELLSLLRRWIELNDTEASE